MLLKSSRVTLPDEKALGPSPAAPSILRSWLEGAGGTSLGATCSTFTSFCSLGGSGFFCSLGGGGGGGGVDGMSVILGALVGPEVWPDEQASKRHTHR